MNIQIIFLLLLYSVRIVNKMSTVKTDGPCLSTISFFSPVNDIHSIRKIYCSISKLNRTNISKIHTIFYIVFYNSATKNVHAKRDWKTTFSETLTISVLFIKWRGPPDIRVSYFRRGIRGWKEEEEEVEGEGGVASCQGTDVHQLST